MSRDPHASLQVSMLGGYVEWVGEWLASEREFVSE